MPRETQRILPAESHAHLVKLLKWPITFFLMFTSVPAGFAPFFAAGVFRSMQHFDAASRRSGDPHRVAADQTLLRGALVVSALSLLIQCAMSWLAWRKWNGLLLGFRGAGWFAVLWGAFTVGLCLGVWIYTVAPE
jgi:hypothetical protein